MLTPDDLTIAVKYEEIYGAKDHEYGADGIEKEYVDGRKPGGAMGLQLGGVTPV